MKSCGKFQPNLNPGFQFSPPRNGKISWSRREGQNFKFHQFVSSKGEITWAKSWHSSFLSWQWRAVESFSQIWILVSNSAYQEMAKFLVVGKKIKPSKFFDWFCLKDTLFVLKNDTTVSCPDSKGLWKVSAKGEWWFPIQSRLMKNLHLDCFALHLCIVFHRINLSTTYFNATPQIPSQVMPCATLHYTLYLCSMYPALSLSYLFLLTYYTKILTNFIH